MSFFDRFRKSAPEQPPQDPKLNDDWTVGDIAECIVDGGWYSGWDGRRNVGPKINDRYRVVGVSIEFVAFTGKKHWFLQLAGWPTRYDATGFRKVRPVHDEAKSEDEQFLKSLLRDKSPEREEV